MLCLHLRHLNFIIHQLVNISLIYSPIGELSSVFCNDANPANKNQNAFTMGIFCYRRHSFSMLIDDTVRERAVDVSAQIFNLFDNVRSTQKAERDFGENVLRICAREFVDLSTHEIQKPGSFTYENLGYPAFACLRWHGALIHWDGFLSEILHSGTTLFDFAALDRKDRP
jgi:hypothetical protein